MDEFWSRKMMRRLALLTVINSVAIPAVANQPQQEGNEGSAVPRQISAEHTGNSLGSLLTKGWESNQPLTASTQLPAQRHAAAMESAREVQLPKATVYRPKREPLIVTEQAIENTELKPLAGVSNSKSLADLLRNAADLTTEATESTLKPEPAELAGKSDPVNKDQPEVVKESPQSSSQREDGDSTVGKLAELLEKAPPPVFKRQAVKAGVKAKPVSIVSKDSGKNQTSLVVQGLEMPDAVTRQQELLQDTLKKNGFGLLATDGIELPPDQEPVPAFQEPAQPTPAMLHAARLRDVSQSLLREAFHSLRRSASYTARKKATAALRSVTAMRDVADGGNQHSRELDAALIAIRESKEFGAGIEAVDHEQLKRLVAVHQTEVLKNKPLDEVSSIGAMAAYLEFARKKLVAASGQHHEASYALQLLGQIEQHIKGPMDTQAASIALTYQRSAVEVDPSNSVAHYELGKTYFSQGLLEFARAALTKSIELSPSRGAYEELMATGRKLGDIDTVRICKHALADPSLPSSIPVYQLDPAVFAATHRPNLAQVQHQHTQAKSPQPSQTHLGKQ